MTIIKARIYDKTNHRMLYSYEPDEQGHREYYPLVFGIGFSHWEKEWLSEPMLYLGMKDKHGADMYEGDRVRGEKGEGWIVYDKTKGAWRVQMYDGWHTLDSCELEVIGDIYENPDLIQEPN